MLTKSEKSNPNYLAEVVSIKELRPIEGADRIQVAIVNFGEVVVSKQVKEGDIMVYFPVESKISSDFLSATNSFRDVTLNKNKENKGFFEDKGRVKAMKMMKGKVKSSGYLVPVTTVFDWAYEKELSFTYSVGEEFDTINGKLLVEKYQAPRKAGAISNQGKKPKVSRLVEGQVHLHVDTENLRRNADKIKPEDTISITYKTHGTSWWVGNVLVKRKLSKVEKVMKWLGFPVNEMKYDLVYGSRRVVKNADMDDPKQKDHFFGYDLWEKIKDEVGEAIPKGFTLYGEMLGYDHNGGAIQDGFDYGCVPMGLSFDKDQVVKPQHKLEVYRITQTNPDGLVIELSYPEIAEFCGRKGLVAPHLFFYGKAKDWLAEQVLFEDVNWDERNWSEMFVQTLEKVYNEKDCFMCDNPVPEEGIVVRKESLFNCESYKLKSFRFLEGESKQLDTGEVDIESEN